MKYVDKFTEDEFQGTSGGLKIDKKALPDCGPHFWALMILSEGLMNANRVMIDRPGVTDRKGAYKSLKEINKSLCKSTINNWVTVTKSTDGTMNIHLVISHEKRIFLDF